MVFMWMFMVFEFFSKHPKRFKMIMKSRKHFKALDDLLSKSKFLRIWLVMLTSIFLHRATNLSSNWNPIAFGKNWIGMQDALIFTKACMFLYFWIAIKSVNMTLEWPKMTWSRVLWQVWRWKHDSIYQWINRYRSMNDQWMINESMLIQIGFILTGRVHRFYILNAFISIII